MKEKISSKMQDMMVERFGHDTLLSLATVEDGKPFVRMVNGYYEEGAFYIVTHACSHKMMQIQTNPVVAVCGEWFVAHGIGENLGHPWKSENIVLAAKLRKVFSAWYENGHTDENDANTCILRIRLTDGVLLHHGARYAIDFGE